MSELFSSKEYWEKRYASGGNSGAGSYGRLALFKGAFLNSFISANEIYSVLEFGCGDGNQLQYYHPKKYLGFDVSQAAVDVCRKKYAHEENYAFCSPADNPEFVRHDLVLSLDVIFHLVENEVFSSYIDRLFDCSKRYVVIYSSNFDGIWPNAHVRHRKVSEFIENNITGWRLCAIIPNAFPYSSDDVNNTSFCEFLVYSMRDQSCIVTLESVAEFCPPEPL